MKWQEIGCQILGKIKYNVQNINLLLPAFNSFTINEIEQLEKYKLLDIFQN